MNRLLFGAVTAAATAAGALGSRRAASLTKPLPMLLVAGAAARGWRDRSVLDNTLLATAIGTSMIGDRAMLLEEFSPVESDDEVRRRPVSAPLTAKDSRLAWGATFFAGAQLSYCALMARRGARIRGRSLAPRMAALGESAAIVAYHRPRLLPVLGPYGNTLATMSALAADLDHRGDPSGRQLRIGGLLFLASDLTILNRRHLIDHPTLRIAGEVWVLASYFTAQALLIDGLSKETRPGR
ncbi:lysoplasmalogenase family protein [Gordonia desulfuricans]|nr:lysoplasmalogenase family protein [Gordonia desulfuricans]